MRVLLCIICSINPINFLVSGFHGNTDPLFIFLILLAIYFAENKFIFFSGLLYGLSLCIKIVPIILAPMFIFYMGTKKEKVIFILSSLIIPVIVFSPYLISDFLAIKQNVFQYGSLTGIWGFQHILKAIFTNESINSETRKLAYEIFKWHISYGRLLLLGIILGMSKVFMSSKKLSLTKGIFFVFCLFLSITPGFGVQYLSWLSYYAVMVTPVLGTIYLLVGGIFLYRVYNYWGGGVSPYYANSDAVGQWVGFEQTLDILLWTIVIMMLTWFLLKNFTPRQKAPPVKAGMNGVGSGFARANPAIKDATAVKPWSFTIFKKVTNICLK